MQVGLYSEPQNIWLGAGTSQPDISSYHELLEASSSFCWKRQVRYRFCLDVVFKWVLIMNIEHCTLGKCNILALFFYAHATAIIYKCAHILIILLLLTMI